MNFTPLDQAYQIHHCNPIMYNSNQILTYNPKCIYCNHPRSIPLMEKQDGGAFRQCENQSCRKQFNSKQQTNTNFKDNNTFINYNNTNPNTNTKNPNPNQQTQNPYLPSEPKFISKFNTTY